jgi:hypothetical protein
MKIGYASEKPFLAMHTLSAEWATCGLACTGAWASFILLAWMTFQGPLGRSSEVYTRNSRAMEGPRPGWGVHGTLERLSDSDVQALAERI